MTIQLLKKIAVLITSSVISWNSITAENNSKMWPNIIIILADDLGYGDVSCFNENSKIITPHLDKLASEGIQFTDAHTSSAVCTPTRYGILTGRYNWRSRLKNGVLSGYSEALIDNDRLTVGKLLQNKNYHTAFIGKWHLGWDWQLKSSYTNNKDIFDSGDKSPDVDFSKPVKNGPQERGFDYSYGFSGSLDMPPYVYVENGMPTFIPHDTTQCVDEKGFWRKGITGPDFRHVEVLPHLTDKSIQYIDSKAKNRKPFFLYFALPAPHTPILPTTEFLGLSNTNFYGDFVLQVDDVVGKIVSTLEKHGIRNSTMVLFASDNGCSPRADFEELKKVGHNPSYIFRGSKADIYEGGHRVPFIVSWPDKIKKGQLSDEIICTTDILATIAEITGYKLQDNAGEDSYSFLPVMTGKNLKSPLREATVHHSVQGRFAIRQGQWKLILCPGSGGWSFPRTKEELENLPKFQLYNLSNDPSELNNVVEKFPDKVAHLKKLLTKYISEGRSTPGKPQKNEGMNNWTEIDILF